jgi:hypothetical protein
MCDDIDEYEYLKPDHELISKQHTYNDDAVNSIEEYVNQDEPVEELHTNKIQEENIALAKRLSQMLERENNQIEATKHTQSVLIQPIKEIEIPLDTDKHKRGSSFQFSPKKFNKNSEYLNEFKDFILTEEDKVLKTIHKYDEKESIAEYNKNVPVKQMNEDLISEYNVELKNKNEFINLSYFDESSKAGFPLHNYITSPKYNKTSFPIIKEIIKKDETFSIGKSIFEISDQDVDK